MPLSCGMAGRGDKTATCISAAGRRDDKTMNGAIGGLLNLLPVRQQLAVIEQTGIYFHVAADAEIVAARWVRHGVVGAADIGIDMPRRIAVDEHVIRTVILAPGQVIGRVDAGDDVALQPECDFIAIALIDRRAGGIAVLQIAGDKAIPNVLVFVVARATRDADVAWFLRLSSRVWSR